MMLVKSINKNKPTDNVSENAIHTMSIQSAPMNVLICVSGKSWNILRPGQNPSEWNTEQKNRESCKSDETW